MNTIGKILVILNFVFAIAVGVFLVFDFALRTKWHEAYTSLQRQADVLKTAQETTAKSAQTLAADVTTKKKENDALKEKLKEMDEKNQVIDDVYKVRNQELTNKLTDSDLTVQELLKAKQRLTDEIALLGKIVKEREATITNLDADVKKFRISAQANELLAKTIQQRNEILLDQLRGVEAVLARVRAGASPDAGGIRATGLNMPTTKVSGKIEKVDAVDNGLVEISVGSDQGVNKDHTLDVYRLKPKAEFLGTIRIVDSYPHKSVGRLIPSGTGAFRPQLRAGDLVASYITKN